jgi:hypothetical protein
VVFTDSQRQKNMHGVIGANFLPNKGLRRRDAECQYRGKTNEKCCAYNHRIRVAQSA